VGQRKLEPNYSSLGRGFGIVCHLERLLSPIEPKHLAPRCWASSGRGRAEPSPSGQIPPLESVAGSRRATRRMRRALREFWVAVPGGRWRLILIPLAVAVVLAVMSSTQTDLHAEIELRITPGGKCGSA
jgi:hypothetical protein